MGETPQRPNLWAPWRMAYLDQLRASEGSDAGGCFLCDYVRHPEDDRANFVLERTPHCLVVMNRFPYTNGHLLIAPLQHTARLADLPPATAADLMRLTGEWIDRLERVLGAQGFNVGMNIGKCAGAGLPDHVHQHVVPRWEGDTNFMPVIGGAHVIPQSLDDLYERLRGDLSGQSPA